MTVSQVDRGRRLRGNAQKVRFRRLTAGHSTMRQVAKVVATRLALPSSPPSPLHPHIFLRGKSIHDLPRLHDLSRPSPSPPLRSSLWFRTIQGHPVLLRLGRNFAAII